ncbi:MAG: hypothetical protein RDV48_28175 [Candidatus Eremiobacteraeota bacterium]|nr:hypothetical protein [Candidatus Eremiobacteraeota bacterium]
MNSDINTSMQFRVMMSTFSLSAGSGQVRPPVQSPSGLQLSGGDSMPGNPMSAPYNLMRELADFGGPGGAMPSCGGPQQMMQQMLQMMKQMMDMMMGMFSRMGMGGSPGGGCPGGGGGCGGPGAPPFGQEMFPGQAGQTGAMPQAVPDAGATMGSAKGTGYYPDSSAMEGGFTDKRGKKLCTLQDYLEGKAPYVSIALDKNLYKSGQVKYGDAFRIPELEKRYGRPILFRAVDTGGAFNGKGFGRVDICTRSARHSLDPTVNGRLTLQRAQ